MKPAVTKLLLLLTFSCYSLIAVSQTKEYNRQEIMIAMRDGIKLNTVIFTPKDQSEPLPFLLSRTPYGVSNEVSPEKNQYIEDMAAEGYIFVFQDIRGRYKSE